MNAIKNDSLENSILFLSSLKIKNKAIKSLDIATFKGKENVPKMSEFVKNLHI